MPARTGSRIQDSRGRSLVLGRLLKSGGAGSVFLLENAPGEVAKLYHPQVDLATYERKLEAMLALCPDLPDREEGGRRYVQIAWPRALARDRRGRLLGFVMPELDIAATSDLEHVLQERQAREAGLPTGLGAKITLAANLAAVMAELHRQHHYVVDLKPLNLRFYRETLYIAMLDCDGFSVQGRGERFPAGQFTADYLAPEFQGRGIGAGQEEAQDRFALAVVVFQLLNFGIHPYSGRPQNERVPTDLPGRIRGNHYAYGLKPSKAMLPNPASGHRMMPESLRRLFDRAFSVGGRDRPTVAEWSECLRQYATRERGLLVACARSSGHQHFAGHDCAACQREALVGKAAKAAATQRRRRERERQARRPARRAVPMAMRVPGQGGHGPQTAPAPAQAPIQPLSPRGRLVLHTCMAALGPVLFAGIMAVFAELWMDPRVMLEQGVAGWIFGALMGWLNLALFAFMAFLFWLCVPFLISVKPP